MKSHFQHTVNWNASSESSQHDIFDIIFGVFVILLGTIVQLDNMNETREGRKGNWRFGFLSSNFAWRMHNCLSKIPMNFQFWSGPYIGNKIPIFTSQKLIIHMNDCFHSTKKMWWQEKIFECFTELTKDILFLNQFSKYAICN